MTRSDLPLARLAAIALALVLGTPARGSDADPANHYILRCDSDCPSWAVDVAIGGPTGVTTDASGNVYFTGQSIVFRIERSGILRRIAGNGLPGYSGDGGPATHARLDVAYETKDVPEFREATVGGLAVGPGGELFVADVRNQRVRRVDASGRIETVFAFPWAGGVPQGLAVDAQGALYVSDLWGAVVRTNADGTVSVLAHGDCGSTNPPSNLCLAGAIALDPAGNVLVPDFGCRVMRIDPDGSLVEVAGYGSPSASWASRCGTSPDGIPAVGAALSRSFAVATDRFGNLYIAETDNHCIRKVDDTGIITTIAGRCGLAGFGATLNDGGPGTNAGLLYPRGVAVDNDGNVYIADTGNFRIRKVGPDGSISTVAGNGRPLFQ